MIVLVERIVGTVSKHPHQFPDSERVARDAHFRFFWCLFALGGLSYNRDFLPDRDDCALVAAVALVTSWIVTL